MRIAFISTVYDYPLSGADALWLRAAEHAVDRGDRVLVAVSSKVAGHSRIHRLKELGARMVVHAAPFIPRTFSERLSRKLRQYWDPSESLLSTIQTLSPELVVFSCGGTYDLTREGHVLACLRVHGLPYRLIANWQAERPVADEAQRERAQENFAAADHLFFVSARNLEITRRHLGQPLPHASVVHCPLRAVPDEGIPWPADQETFSFAAIARLEPIKGLDLLLRALKTSLGGTANWRLNVYGEGPDRGTLAGLADSLGLSNRVIFHGYVDRLDSIWSRNHLLLSSGADEGIPTTLPEAMLCGRPVLATRVGAAEEWITEAETGYLCPRLSVEGLTIALASAWEQRAQWRHQGRQALARARLHYRHLDFRKLILPTGPVY